MRKSAVEVQFFRLIDAEVRKGTRFYTDLEEQFSLRIKSFRSGLSNVEYYLSEAGTSEMGLEGLLEHHIDDMRVRLVRACVCLYREILLLKHWAAYNACGFDKILKKHDRWTGFNTRERYIQNKLSQQPFMNSESLARMQAEVNELFLANICHIKCAKQRQIFESGVAGMLEFTNDAILDCTSYAEFLQLGTTSFVCDASSACSSVASSSGAEDEVGTKAVKTEGAKGGDGRGDAEGEVQSKRENTPVGEERQCLKKQRVAVSTTKVAVAAGNGA
ncbi:unnamed protein product [Chrysoparadoxa australica]